MKNTEFIKITPQMIGYNLRKLPQIIFEVTDACNLKCKYCAFSDLYTGYDRREDKFLPFSIAKNTIDYLVEFWKKNVSPSFPLRLNIGFYGGEPLLNFHLIQQIISYIESFKNLGRSLSYSMTTNGTLLHKYIDYLVEKNFSLLISFDGDEASHSFRVYKNGNNSFQDVYANVKLVEKKYPDYFKSHVAFNAVLHSRNSFETVHRFFKTQFSKIPRISPLSDSDVKEETAGTFNSICNDYSESFYKMNRRDREEAESSDIFSSPRLSGFYKLYEAQSGNVFYDLPELILNTQDYGNSPTGTCLPFAKKMFITVNGKILQCERIDHQYYLGMVTEKEVLLDLEKITNNFNENIFKYIHQCKDCIFNIQCKQCIYRIDHFRTSISCKSYKTGNRPTMNLKLLRENPQLLESIYKAKTAR